MYGVATNFTDMVQRVANIASVILLAKIVRGQDDTRLSLGVGQGIFVFSLLSADCLDIRRTPTAERFLSLIPRRL